MDKEKVKKEKIKEKVKLHHRKITLLKQHRRGRVLHRNLQ
jgi:hypothetical protein